ncbi:hypothetical protein LO762_30925 [Actinocorallia sp. API 0066]|uniref:hypothetical protein n=1 Tax=Actinocorallia sp. API 0066 TaxID=2896846 RepID=UPI001E584A5E|nr:hypothetical protein [Actinocorallia sp. API 0066]MCD0453565.1 hypothetical protein [Actinocorallia sp. API 0066]
MAATALVGLLAVAAIAAGSYIARQTGAGAEEPAPGAAGLPRPATGEPLTLTDTDGHSYRISAVAAGRAEDGRAYAEYVIANAGDAQVPLETPGDLFVAKDKSTATACMEQPGAPSDLCTPPNSTEVLGPVDGSPDVVSDGVDEYMPPHAEYLVRIITDDEVQELGADDIGLYVWNVRFIQDRKARLVTLP